MVIPSLAPYGTRCRLQWSLRRCWNPVGRGVVGSKDTSPAWFCIIPGPRRRYKTPLCAEQVLKKSPPNNPSLPWFSFSLPFPPPMPITSYPSLRGGYSEGRVHHGGAGVAKRITPPSLIFLPLLWSRFLIDTKSLWYVSKTIESLTAMGVVFQR